MRDESEPDRWDPLIHELGSRPARERRALWDRLEAMGAPKGAAWSDWTYTTMRALLDAPPPHYGDGIDLVRAALPPTGEFTVTMIARRVPLSRSRVFDILRSMDSCTNEIVRVSGGDRGGRGHEFRYVKVGSPP